MSEAERVPPQILSLDWKHPLLKRSQVLDKLHEFLNLMDRNGEVRVEVADTQNKVAVCMEEKTTAGGMGTCRLVRYSKPCKKRMSTQMDWFAKAVTVIEELVQRIGNSEIFNLRLAFYTNTIRNPGMTASAYRAMVNDIALSCRMHPTSLGVDAEENGEVFIGKDLQLKIFRAENVFTTDITKTPKFKILASGSEIPSRLYQIRWSGNIRAVLVVEHKNLATQLSLIKDAFNDVIIVKTQGFPTPSTREFIRTLWNELTCRGTKFVYLSDHDWQGANIFTVLKYGSIRSAWASDIMCCPGLIWAGPTRKELYVYHEARIFGEWARVQEAQNRKSTKESVQAVAQKEWETVQRKLRHVLSAPRTEMEKNLYESYFKRLNLLEHEPELGPELRMMLDEGAVSDAILLLTTRFKADIQSRNSASPPYHTATTEVWRSGSS
ncbi:MAG: hypothetical protein Q9226_005280 [Calogaya cf. arnoldii]